MKIYIFIITSLMISCADMFYEKEDHIERLESILGYWFACEFGYSEPDCIILMMMDCSSQMMVKSITSKNSLKCLAMIVMGSLF